MEKFTVLIFVFLYCHRTSFAAETEEPNRISTNGNWIVSTTSGPVEGTITKGFTDQEVHVFYGIPYAEPPTADLRFKPPQPVKPWTEVLQADKIPLPCYQVYDPAAVFLLENGTRILKRPWTEDCLTLNVWVPKPKIKDAPVLVVLHPGFFVFGSNTYPDGSTLSAHAEDIIVSMNYRLGSFGFLYLGVPEVPGNMGLLDQQLALSWIHQNINLFGGKTEAIILVGAGNAGGASAGYHLLSAGSSPFFKSVSTFSGAPTCSWAFNMKEKSLEYGRKLSETLGCHRETTEEEISCLRNVHPEDIVDADLFLRHVYPKFPAPTVDGNFITDSPMNILKSGNFRKATLISAITAHEGATPFWLKNSKYIPDPGKGMEKKEFIEMVKRTIPNVSTSKLSVIQEYYLDQCDPSNVLKIRDSAIRFFSDIFVDCCTNLFHESVADAGSLVMFGIDDLRKSSNPSWMGAPHAIGVDYLFGYPFHDDGYSASEKDLSVLFMNMINDMTRKKASELVFPHFDMKNKTYVLWDHEGIKVHSHYRESYCNLWNNIIPKMKKKK